jgi:spermidine synthase
LNRASFALLVGAFGAVAAVSQLLFMRQALAGAGGFEPVLPLTLAGWLCGAFAGVGLFGLARPTPHLWRGWLTFLPLIWVVVLALCLAYSYFLFPGEPAGPPPIIPLAGLLFKLTLLAAPAGFCSGGLSVLAWMYLARGQTGIEEPAPSAPWIVCCIEAFGAGLGLLLLTLLQAGHVATTEELAAVCGLMVLGQAAALPRKTATRLLLIWVVVLVAIGIHFSGVLGWLDQQAQERRLALLNPKAEKAAFLETASQHLTLAEQEGRPVLYRNQVLDCDRPDPAEVQLYARFFLAQADRFDRILLVGCGLPGFIGEFLAGGAGKLVYVPLDAGETDFFKKNLPEETIQYLKDPRLEIVRQDVRLYLAHRPASPFDLIVILAAHPTNAFINRVHTQECLAAAKKWLTPRGLLVTGLSGDKTYWTQDPASLGPLLFLNLKHQFPHLLAIPGPIHFFLAANSPDVLAKDDETLIRRFRRHGFDTPLLTPLILKDRFSPSAEPTQAGRKIEKIVPNQDLRPATYLAGLSWWEQTPKAPWTRFILRVLRQADRWGPWAAALAFIPALFLLGWPGRDRIMGWASAVSGLVNLGLLTVLLFHFQNRYGTLFGTLGLLMFLYSAGLAAGGFLGWLGAVLNITSRRVLFFIFLLSAELAAAIAFTAAGRIGDHFYLLLPGLGLLTGLEAGLYLAVTPGQRPAMDAVGSLAALRAWNALGGVIGLLLVGVVLVAVVGPVRACEVLLGLKLLSALTLLRLPRRI